MIVAAATVMPPPPIADSTPLALVVRRAGSDVDEAGLRDWTNARLGKMQRLSGVEFRAELPRSALGKVLKRELRAAYWNR